MKKLVVLTLLLAAGMLWSQAAAPAGPALTLNATIAYIGATDLGAGKWYSDQPRFELKFNWVVDDLNIAYLEFEEGTMGVTGKGFNTNGIADLGGPAAPGTNGAAVAVSSLIDKAWFRTDVGKAFKLPVGVTFKYGLEEWNNVDLVKVTKSEWEDFLGERDFRTWGAQIDITPAPVFTLRSSWAWNPGTTLGGYRNLFLVGAYGTMAPINYEVTYFTNSNNANNPDGDFAKGWFEGGVEFNQDMTKDVTLSGAVMGEYDMGDGTGTVANPTWRIQLGAQVLYQKMASLGLAWRGQEEAAAGGMDIQGWAMPVAGKPLELYIQAGLGLDDALYPETFDSLEASIKYSFGKAAYYLGFLYGAEGGQGIAKEMCDMDVAGVAGKGPAAAMTNAVQAIWVRGIIAF